VNTNGTNSSLNQNITTNGTSKNASTKSVIDIDTFIKTIFSPWPVTSLLLGSNQSPLNLMVDPESTGIVVLAANNSKYNPLKSTSKTPLDTLLYTDGSYGAIGHAWSDYMCDNITNATISSTGVSASTSVKCFKVNFVGAEYMADFYYNNGVDGTIGLGLGSSSKLGQTFP
jgi:hypothetical protein